LIEPAIVDTSAFTRLEGGGLDKHRRAEIEASIEDDRVSICLPVLLELGFSAQNAAGHDSLVEDLLGLPWAGIDDAVEAGAIEAQRRLARQGHHRLPPIDLLIASVADRHGLGVLHYDHDFDVIRQRTDFHFESIWLAEPGSL
jgi:predicted nucleic acid-binding protein